MSRRIEELPGEWWLCLCGRFSLKTQRCWNCGAQRAHSEVKLSTFANRRPQGWFMRRTWYGLQLRKLMVYGIAILVGLTIATLMFTLLVLLGRALVMMVFRVHH